MKAEDALELLIDPANAVAASVTIPEGLRVVDIVKILAKNTEFSKQEFEAALADPAALGLPDYAEGNPEGYLFPATYEFGPNLQPADMLRAMVARWEQAVADTDLVAKAEAMGYTPHEMMTIASLRRGRGPRRLHAEDRPGHLQPPGEPRQRGDQRPAPDRRDGQLRARAARDRRG